MQCPKCRNEGLKYVQKNRRNASKSGKERITRRVTNKVYCNKCGYKNESFL